MTSPAFTAIAYPAVRSRPQSEADDQARARGYAAGYAQGAREAERELAAHRAQLDAGAADAAGRAAALLRLQVGAVDTLLRALEARLEPVVENAQDSLAAAAMDLAEAVLGVELRDAGTSAKSIVSRVLATVDATEATIVRVHPGELPLLTGLFGSHQRSGSSPTTPSAAETRSPNCPTGSSMRASPRPSSVHAAHSSGSVHDRHPQYLPHADDSPAPSTPHARSVSAVSPVSSDSRSRSPGSTASPATS